MRRRSCEPGVTCYFSSVYCSTWCGVGTSYMLLVAGKRRGRRGQACVSRRRASAGGRGVRCVPDTGAKPSGDGRGLRSLGLLALLPPALALRTICFCCSRLPVDQQRPHHLQVDEKCRRPSPSPSLRTQTLPWNKGLSQIVRTEVWEALVIFTGSAAMLMLQR